MDRVIALSVYWLLFGGWTLVFFIGNLRKLLHWRERTGIADGKILLALLPPLLVAGLMAYPTLAEFSGKLPAAEEDLFEVSAPIESVRQYTSTRSRGRSGSYKVYRYYISLEGYQGSLYIPLEYNFDQNAFLRWAGPDVVTFRYAHTDGRNMVYAIEKADGAVFLDYDFAVERLQTAAADDLITAIVFVVFFAALFLKCPQFLYQDKKGGAARWAAVIFGGGGLVLLLLGLSMLSKPTVTETSADASPPIIVEITEGVEVTLPRGWALGAVGENDTQWYKAAEKVSTTFRLTRWPWDLPEEEWCQELLADHRGYLLETFIKTPREAMGPFLEELRRSEDFAQETDFWVSEGWGTSENNYKNHFLLVFLPRQQCEVVIQSSSKSLSWKKLRAYAEEWVYPLLSGIEVTERP